MATSLDVATHKLNYIKKAKIYNGHVTYLKLLYKNNNNNNATMYRAVLLKEPYIKYL